MNKVDWSAPTDADTVVRRAAGRAHYNSWRRFMAWDRRRRVVELLGRYSLTTHGTQARIARDLGVSATTICRDVKALLYPAGCLCPTCGSVVPRERLD